MEHPLGQALLGLGTGLLSGLGVGGGSLLVALLSGFFSVGQQQAQGINLLSFLPAAGAAVYMHKKRGDLVVRAALWAVGAGVPAAAAGSLLGSALPEMLLKKAFGGVLLLTGLRGFFKKREE